MPRIIKPSTGAFTTADISVDSSGRVYSVSSGSGGAQPMNMLLAAGGPAAANITTNPGTSQVLAYCGGGGGGAGGQNSANPSIWQQSGGTGGAGGWGFHTLAVTGGTTLAYNVGAAGTAGTPGNTGTTGGTGGATTLTNVGTSNGGIGGNGGRTAGVQGTTGSQGSAPGGVAMARGLMVDEAVLTGGGPKVTNVPATVPVVGFPGVLMVYEM